MWLLRVTPDGRIAVACLARGQRYEIAGSAQGPEFLMLRSRAGAAFGGLATHSRLAALPHAFLSRAQLRGMRPADPPVDAPPQDDDDSDDDDDDDAAAAAENALMVVMMPLVLCQLGAPLVHNAAAPWLSAVAPGFTARRVERFIAAGDCDDRRPGRGGPGLQLVDLRGAAGHIETLPWRVLCDVLTRLDWQQVVPAARRE